MADVLLNADPEHEDATEEWLSEEMRYVQELYENVQRAYDKHLGVDIPEGVE